ncbi:hypothetical protein QTI33_31610 [Variovorax sp. J22P271]|uniref:hypothetical protein n=1 Tax=Variovorax davisae TaxID=3053515 RepID=UPI0025778272|nr:hypothetical protein [Variovorax sp. J22P271]MDM0036719.1 hypothetical protein [Variovorax sp. J22P271]
MQQALLVLEDAHAAGEQLVELRCAACCATGMSEASADGIITRMSTPRFATAHSASIASLSGRK